MHAVLYKEMVEIQKQEKNKESDQDRVRGPQLKRDGVQACVGSGAGLFTASLDYLAAE